MTMPSLLSEARRAYHHELAKTLLTIETFVPKKGKDKGKELETASNADNESDISRQIALSIAKQLGVSKGVKLKAQSSGNEFEAVTSRFIGTVFRALGAIRPGEWAVSHIVRRHGIPIAAFEQFAHLTTLADLARERPELAVLLGNSYAIAPDIVVSRQRSPDAAINSGACIVDDTSGTRSDLRFLGGERPLLHASISCKWTMRSDRAQNARSEALNLIRNRKGRTPHIAVVVGEPLPSRIASLALGTGDIDCVYHFALYELERAVSETGESEAANILRDMIDGRRLKDISDLPLDLAV